MAPIRARLELGVAKEKLSLVYKRKRHKCKIEDFALLIQALLGLGVTKEKLKEKQSFFKQRKG